LNVTRLSTFFRRLLPPAALAAALLIAGCGIKGPLELPEGTKVSSDDGKNNGKGKFEPSPKAMLPGYYDVLSSKAKKEQQQLGKPVTPDQPFVLDPLLN
jgi:predicted small lipoprotein YifL